MQFMEYIESCILPRKINVLLVIGKIQESYFKCFELVDQNVIINLEKSLIESIPFVDSELTEFEMDLISGKGCKYNVIGILIGDTCLKYQMLHHDFLKMILERPYIPIYYTNKEAVEDYFRDNELIFVDENWRTKVWPYVSMRKGFHIGSEKLACTGLNF